VEITGNRANGTGKFGQAHARGVPFIALRRRIACLREGDAMRITLIVTVALAVLCLASNARAETIVVTAARMVDVLTGREVERPQIIITNDRIVAVGRQGDPAPAEARKVDLGDRTLLPGLIQTRAPAA
jgi:hypothetical protein